MIVLSSNKANDTRYQNAASKARELKLKIKETGLAHYEVLSEGKTSFYRVEYTKRGGQFWAACTCKAGARNEVCKHVMAPLPHFKMRLRAQIEARKAAPALVTAGAASEMAPAPAPAPAPASCKSYECGEVAVTGEGYCEPCQALKDKMDIFG